MIAIVNYGSGNIQAIANIFGRLKVPFVVASTPSDLQAADKLVLPGVGAFDQAINELDRSGMRAALDQAVMHEGRPILGICVGMQLFARSSDEGSAQGLGWLDGTVRRFDRLVSDRSTKLPHMGWNTVEPRQGDGLFEAIDAENGFYFLHSYCVVCADPNDVLATTEYGGRFTSAVRRGNVFGVQFHPEKSHQNGVQLLKTFAGL